MIINGKKKISVGLAKVGDLKALLWSSDVSSMPFDISLIITDLEIDFELGKFAKGYMEITDVNSQFNKTYMIIGGEIITLTIIKDPTELPYIGAFRIANIDLLTAPELDTPSNKNTYRLDLISEAYYQNLTNEYLKGFEGETSVDQIVSFLFASLSSSPAAKKKIIQNSFVSKSSTLLNNFIIPGWSAEKTLSQLKKISICEDGDSFVFYENQYALNWATNTSFLRNKYKAMKICERVTEDVGDMQMLILAPTVLNHNFDQTKNVEADIVNRNIITKKVNFDYMTKKDTVTIKDVHTDVVDKFITLGDYSLHNPRSIEDSKRINPSEFLGDPKHLDNTMINELRKNSFNNYHFEATIPAVLSISPGTIIYYDMMASEAGQDDLMSGPWLLHKHTLCLKIITSDDSTDANTEGRYFLSKFTLSRDSFSSQDSTRKSINTYKTIGGTTVVQNDHKALTNGMQ